MPLLLPTALKIPDKQYLADRAIEREKKRHEELTGNKQQTKPRKLEVTPREETPRVKAIHSVENKIRKQNFESAAVIDDNGNELFFKNGQRSQVGFTRIECMQMNNATLTHNHPRCSMFSPEDLKCMVANNMYEMRATNRDGTTYSMKRANGGYSANKALDFVGAYAAKYPDSTKHAQKDLDSRGFADKIWKGEITADEANIEFGRSTAKYMADWAAQEAPKYGLIFTVELSATTTTKSIKGHEVMKSDGDYIVLDKEMNDLENRAFREWLERAKRSSTAKSFSALLKQKGE